MLADPELAEAQLLRPHDQLQVLVVALGRRLGRRMEWHDEHAVADGLHLIAHESHLLNSEQPSRGLSAPYNTPYEDANAKTRGDCSGPHTRSSRSLPHACGSSGRGEVSRGSRD